MQEAKATELEAKFLTQAKAEWRKLFPSDIESLVRIANKIHLALLEGNEVFAERVKLFPDGCLALVQEGDNNELCGYAISHPIEYRRPPALNSLLGEIATAADQYYIHDIAIMPDARGQGHARECMETLFAVAARFETTSLVSVYGTASFWGRYGFVPEKIGEGFEAKLLEYGEDAVYLERNNENCLLRTKTGAI